MGQHNGTPRWFSIGERGRRIAHAGSWSLVAKASAAAHLFISVPFVLAALGPTRFGAWATLVALVTFAGFLDFGIGNGAMNLVASAHGRGAKAEITTILREARRTLFQVAACLFIVVILAGFAVPWYRVLGMPVEMAMECRAAVLVVLVSIVASVPLNLANRIQLGLGRGDRTFRWQAIGQWLALTTVIASAKLHASLPTLTAAAVATPLIATALNFCQLWRRMDVRTTPAVDGAERAAIRRTIRMDGLAFFGLQLSAAMAFSADLPLISALASAREAGQYAIAQRLFSVVPLTLSLVWTPLWPIYRHAIAGGDTAWAARTFRRSLVAAISVAFVLGTILAMFFYTITSFWVHRALDIAPLLIAGMAVWCVIEATGSAISTLLNAAGIMRYQLIVATLFVATCVAGKVWALTHAGMEWMPWVTLITYTVMFLVPTSLLLPRLLDSALHRHH